MERSRIRHLLLGKRSISISVLVKTVVGVGVLIVGAIVAAAWFQARNQLDPASGDVSVDRVDAAAIESRGVLPPPLTTEIHDSGAEVELAAPGDDGLAYFLPEGTDAGLAVIPPAEDDTGLSAEESLEARQPAPPLSQ